MNGDVSPTTPPAPPAAPQATSREFLAVVFRRKWIIIGLFIVTTATVAIVTLSSPLDFASVGRVLVKRGEQESVMVPGRRMVAWEEDLATEAQVVTSWTVRMRAQELADAQAKSPAQKIWLRPGDIDVQVIGQSNVIEISYADRDPLVAQRGCQAVLQAYVEYRSESGALPYPRAFFEGELSRVSAELDSLERVRREFSISHGVVDIGEQSRTGLSLLQLLNHDRSQVSALLANEMGSLRVMMALRDNPDVDVPVTGTGFLNETAVRDLKASLVEQETRVAHLAEHYRDDAPQLVDARATLATMKGLLRREVDQRLQLSNSKVQGLQSQVETLDAQIAKLKAELEEVPAKESRLGELNRKLTSLKTRYMDLARDSDQARVTEQTSRRISILVLSPPGIGRQSNKHDYVRLALAPAFSLLIGIGLAFFIDGLDTRLRSAGQLEDALELPVLASLNERKG